MRIYDTEARRKVELVPREQGKVAMYVCGPTVYNHVHIGNARTFISFDTIRRYLMWKGYDVAFVSNITDVDDKIINRANEEGTTAAAIAERYTDAFIDVMHRLNILDPTVRPKATEEIDDMIKLVELLIERGHAYEREGSVYFSVRSWPRYGHLSGRDINDLMAGSRDQRGGNFEEDKDDPLDFALWKAAKPGEPAWESPWGMGRPGWHIECSTMSAKYLGLPLDIHGGGADLIFPHHENEAAQSEAAYGGTFSSHWMHGGMLLVDSEKMSKSLGNFMLAKDVLDHNDADVVRLFMLQTHYRSPLDYSKEGLDNAAASYDRIATSLRNLKWAAVNLEPADGSGEGSSPAPATEGEGTACESAAESLEAACVRARDSFTENMDDDFNTAGALGAIFTLVGEANTALAQVEAAPDAAGIAAIGKAADTITELGGVLGILFPEKAEGEAYPPEVKDLAAQYAGYAGDDCAAAVQALLDVRAKARA